MQSDLMKTLLGYFHHDVSINVWTAREKEEEIKAWLFSNFGKENYGHTFTGPVEFKPKLSSTWLFSKEEDALAFKLTWQTDKIEIMMIDPPNGRRYGFPRAIPAIQIGRAEDWLVENGYPQTEIDQFGKGHLPYRMWSE